MKKIIISVLFVAVFAGYVVFQHFGKQASLAQNNAQNYNAVPLNPTPTNSISSTSSSNSSSAGSSPRPTSTPATKPAFKNGTYTGSVVDAYYGYVQVQAVVSGGKISDVKFLQYPNDHEQSVQINSYAMPILRSEAIQAQNANVDIVSGATQTSEAFRQSLYSALTQAQG